MLPYWERPWPGSLMSHSAFILHSVSPVHAGLLAAMSSWFFFFLLVCSPEKVGLLEFFDYRVRRFNLLSKICEVREHYTHWVMVAPHDSSRAGFAASWALQLWPFGAGDCRGHGGARERWVTTGYCTQRVTTLYTQSSSSPSLAVRLNPSYSQLYGLARGNQLHG